MSETIQTAGRATNSIIKYVSVAVFLLIAYAIYLAHISPATGYESSIYEYTPGIFWVILIGATIWGILVVVQQVYTDGFRSNNTWLVGFSIVFLCYAVLFSVYIIRGYTLFNINGDTATHLSLIRQIVDTGFVPSTLIYPIMHLFAAEFQYLSGIPAMIYYRILPMIFYLFYIPAFYLMARQILPEKGQAILAMTAACTFLTGVLPFAMAHIYFVPNMLANAMIPALLLVVFKFLKTSSPAWGALTFILLILYPPFHPLATIALIMIIAGIPVANFVYRLFDRKFTVDNKSLVAFNAVIVLVLLVWLMQWVSFYWDGAITSLLRYIFYGGANYLTLVGNDASQANQYGYGIWYILGQILKTMGGVLFFMLLALISLPLILLEMRHDKRLYTLLLLYGPIVLLGLTMTALYISNLSMGPLRILEYLSILSTVIVGYFIYHLIIKARGKGRYIRKAALCLMVAALCVVFVNGTFILYPTPYYLMLNEQTTPQEAGGMQWILQAGDSNLTIDTLTLAPYRYAQFMLSPAEVKAWHFLGVYPSEYPDYLRLPYHFGYDTNDTLASHYLINLYLVTTLRDTTQYTEIQPAMAKYRYEPSDFDNLSYDRSLNKIYTNSEMDVWTLFQKSAIPNGGA